MVALHTSHLSSRKFQQQPRNQMAVGQQISNFIARLLVWFTNNCGTSTGSKFSGQKYPQKSNYKYSAWNGHVVGVTAVESWR